MSSFRRTPLPKKMPTTSAICAIALQEERYIDEWIRYHLSLGFHNIYVYDNSDDHSLKNKQSDRVTIIHFPGKSLPNKPKQIDAYHAFITKNNINEILQHSAFAEDLGMLSIDIDGNDWFILEAISFYKPRILICEYNDVFGKERAISVPYDPQFVRTKEHYSNLYFGASIAAMAYLAEKKGYALVGVNSNHNNAFFIRQDLVCDSVPKVDLEDIYEPSNIRESRNESGRLTHLAGNERLALLKGLPILNVKTNTLELL